MKNSNFDDIDAAVAAAHSAAAEWGASPATVRAKLLRALADALDEEKEALTAIADRETSLGAARLSGEVARTSFQLRGFADQVDAGMPFSATVDRAVAGPPPLGRPQLTRIRVPVGPVAMFSASNFPFAFSVLGGDTASALAAGCPVVVKPHPGHPALSKRVHELASGVLRSLGLPGGLITMVEGDGPAVGVHLVRHPGIAAVAFTGSLRGGTALLKEANGRARPIPFYGELGSINPVIALPKALKAQGSELGKALAASIAAGSGQFCTSPGVVVVFNGDESTGFLESLTNEMGRQSTHPMLTPAIESGFRSGHQAISNHLKVKQLLPGGMQGSSPRPALLETSAEAFIADHALREEVFGPLCIVVKVNSVVEATRVLEAVGGSLTVTIWGAEDGGTDVRELVDAAMKIAGRVLFSGVPTGVAVSAAQQHGGPWPASTQPFTTSVGYAAMDRFLRPVALQDAPPWLQPASK